LTVNRKWWRSLLSVSVVLMLVLAACQSSGESPTEEPDESTPAEESEPAETEDDGGEAVAGEIIVSGSSTVEPISSIVLEDFAASNPDVVYEVDGPGTGDGFALFCAGDTDVSNASRPINEEEVALCEEAGINYVELKVGVDGLSVITSTNNADVTCLSFGDLYALLGPESQGFETWDAANDLAAEIGDEFGAINAPYPSAPLDITGPGEESGTYDSFAELALGDASEARAEAGSITEDQIETTRPDYQASADDNVIIENIGGSDSSLGWVGFAFANENADAIKLLEVDGGDGCVAATPETIASNEYPLSRDLFIYVNTDYAAENAALAAMVDYYLSDDGIAAVEEAGYVPLEDSALEETRAAWEGR
jgi:phosphate transport system substrate-binding protein